MAIDSLRDRQSIVSINALFSGPSVVPDSSFDQGDRQTIGYGYYGINVGTTVTTIGGTSQLEAFSSTGGLDVQANHTIGGTSQLEAYSSTGGLDVTGNKTIGGVSQLEVFTSTGGITVQVPKTVGGTSQLEAFTSTGTIDSGEARAGGQRGPVTTDPKRRKKRKKAKKEEEYYTTEAFLKKVESGKIEVGGVEVYLEEPIEVPRLDLQPIGKIKDDVEREIAQIMRKQEEIAYEIKKEAYIQEMKRLEEMALFVMFALLDDDF